MRNNAIRATSERGAASSRPHPPWYVEKNTRKHTLSDLSPSPQDLHLHDGMSKPYDVLAIGAHPDDLEAVLGGTAMKLVDKGRSVLFVDLCDGEPTRYGVPGHRAHQAERAASHD